MKPKIWYIIFMFAVLFAMGLAYLDAHNNGEYVTESALTFYLIFPAFLGMVPILFDTATTGKKYEEIKTTSVEEPRKFMGQELSIKTQLFLAVLVMGFVAFRIFTTRSAFIPYPTESFLRSMGKPGAALMSGLFGVMEDWMFFGFFFSSITYFFSKKLGGSGLLGVAPGILATCVFFMGYHFFVYHALMDAMVSVFIFAAISAISTKITNSLIISNVFHFTNNAVASLVNAKVALVIG